MPTIIYRADTIVTLTAQATPAFAVAGERIVATGGVAELRERYRGAEVVDFETSVVTPGFNDAHAHLAMAAEDLLHLDVSTDAVGSLAELFTVLAERCRATPAGAWVRGSRYDDAKMREGRVITRDDLDAVSRDHPIMVLHVAGHWGVVNSAALACGGIDESTEPPAGGRFGYDANGRLNGILFEQAIFDYAYPQAARRERTVAPPSSPADRRRGLARAMRAFHAAGLTSITDALIGPADIALFADARDAGELTMRVNMLVHFGHYERLRGAFAGTAGDEWLRFGGVKSFVDGAIGGRTCLMDEPFEGTSDDFGMQTLADADLRDVVRLVHGDGVRVCVHANGDRAIRTLLDQLEAAERAQPRPGLRHRIEHCSIINAEILERMRRLGAIAVPFGSYVHYHGAHLLAWYGPKRIERMFAHRAFLDAGVAVAGSSDYPCGPYAPLLALQSCVTRTGADGTPLGTSQRISAREALALYTVGAAFAAGEDAFKGRIAPGFLADFVVLDEDPLTVNPARLGTLPVRATYVGGRAVWSRAA